MWQIDAVQRKETMKAMTENFYAAMFGYDEVRFRGFLIKTALMVEGFVK